MSRFLHRPMFRRGGSTGEGITSGLRQGYKEGDFPISEDVSSKIMSVPMHPYLEESNINKIDLCNHQILLC